ncbi:DUF4890 domain-containing protein [Parabacteroides pacaensis]|uniref:DUF4890 domain-containing protein n=1 Tax=Parabacteroides pacaensis TaxID=2086575 RepID=UPI000D0EFF1D|nr:DUF4890 domain-containing protein [Parabacteroides pacaensis]
MKKVLAICLIAMICSVSSFAQQENAQQKRGERGRMMDPKKRTEQMCKELNLNEKQTKEFTKINDEFFEKMKKQRESGEKDRTKLREAMEKLQNDREAQIKKVLTDEQYKKYTAKQEEMRKNMRNRGGDRPRRN